MQMLLLPTVSLLRNKELKINKAYMFERRNIKYIYLKLSRKIKDFLLSDKSREFLIFLFFFFIAGGFWLLQTLNNDYEAEFSIPVLLNSALK